MLTASENRPATVESPRSYQFCRWMTSVVLHVVHRCPIVVKQSMFSMVERIFGFVGGSDIVLRLRMIRGPLVVPRGGLVMIGRDEMKRPSGEICRSRNSR